MVADVEPIQKLLAWAEEKQVAYFQWDALERKEREPDNKRGQKSVYEPPALRSYYHSRVRARVLAGVHTLDRILALDLALDRTLILDRTNALDLDRTLALDPDLAFDQALDRSLAYAETLDLDLDLDLANARASCYDYINANALIRARARAHARTVARTRVYACMLELDEFADQCKTLFVPDVQAPQENWNTYADKLRQIIDNSRDLRGINYLNQSVTKEDKAYLDDTVWDESSARAYVAYIKGTALLLDCLALAIAGNRKEIEAQLLLPA